MKDNYGREINYMRISVTDLCNLRCRYCMPEHGVPKRSHSEMMTAEETVSAAKAAASLGISKIRITGGEPLVKRGIMGLCSEIAETDGIGELCLTTNGTMLRGMARELKAAGVGRINISLDTLDKEKYRYITRTGELKEALDGIHAALDAGFRRVKINSVLVGGFNDNEIADFVRLTERLPVDVRFIELMPIGGGREMNEGAFLSCSEVLKKVPELASAGEHDGVAEMYSLPGATGRVGLIRPIACDFCGRCNKIRLTSDGMLKPCLHSGHEICIRGKSEEEMKSLIREAVISKPENHGELGADSPSRAGRDMNMIGG